ncbi:MAG: dihydrolipoamide acetyltransferase family protein [Alphaproteobacteria bacterium]
MDVVMPQLGETVTEGTVTRWYKKVGERIEADESLFDVATEKVETEIPAPAAGTVTEIRVGEGETVDVGTVLAVIAGDGDAAEVATNVAAAPPSSPAPKAEARTRPSGGPSGSGGRAKLSPVVRRLLEEHGLRPEDITGTGPGGRIRRDDVLAHVESGGAGAPPATAGDADDRTVIPFSRRRLLTAEHMTRSKATSAHVLQATEVDFHGVDAARGALQDDWKAKQGYSLSYLPFIAHAVCQAIADFPNVNAHVDGDNLVVFGHVNLAIAVDLDFQGLVVPVIREAEAKSVADLARAIHDLAGRARTGKLRPDEFAGGTYTITNSGAFGTLITAPIINQPQVAILSTDGIKKRPVVIEGDKGDDIVVRPVGILAQSFDHRAIDGAYSAAFLGRVKTLIETTDWLAELG